MAVGRLLHWGPLVAILIIKCVSLTTLYYLVQWSVPLWWWSYLLNLCLYCGLIVTTFFNFFAAVFNGPGHVPRGWRPKRPEDEQYLQYCHTCEGFKAPRSHHCSKCNRCCFKMDHHCPWINNCVGFANQRHFFYFLLSAVIGSVHSSALLCISLYRALYYIPNANRRYIYLSAEGLFIMLISVGMCLGVVVAVGALLFIQTKILIRNKTSIEEWIIAKANMRKRDSPFVYPYNLGFFKNIRQVLFDPVTDGISWPVIEGCDQFTLTYEQILQKREKLENSSLCRVVEPYNGRFFPLFSQGCRVCITFPINDDPRMALEVGDEVLVTHCHRQWLYGQRLSKDPTRRRKGWFPKRCAVLLVKQYSENELNELLGHQQGPSKMRGKAASAHNSGGGGDSGGIKGDNKKNK
ncbi:Palmitoyltransferase zdhhc6 [Tyrophagus putrescentiae]|nr:Palmitoyltransferase zdhhc6 [Tyrophagus putrescentiae]